MLSALSDSSSFEVIKSFLFLTFFGPFYLFFLLGQHLWNLKNLALVSLLLEIPVECVLQVSWLSHTDLGDDSWFIVCFFQSLNMRCVDTLLGTCS